LNESQVALLHCPEQNGEVAMQNSGKPYLFLS